MVGKFFGTVGRGLVYAFLLCIATIFVLLVAAGPIWLFGTYVTQYLPYVMTFTLGWIFTFLGLTFATLENFK
jgi:hypothetical protein